MVLDEPFDKGIHTEKYKRSVHGDRKVWMDYHDGIKIVQDRVKWLYKAVSYFIKKQRSLTLNQSRVGRLSWENKEDHVAGSALHCKGVSQSGKCFTVRRRKQGIVLLSGTLETVSLQNRKFRR